MTKNKIVVFDKIGRAKIYITDNPESIPPPDVGEKMMINPDLSYVKDFPPELWTIEGEKIVPIFDKGQIKKRLDDIGVKQDIQRLSDKVQRDLSNLVQIPFELDRLRREIIDAEKSVKHMLLKEYEFMQLNNEKTHTKMKFLIAILVLNVVLSAVSVYFSQK